MRVRCHMRGLFEYHHMQTQMAMADTSGDSRSLAVPSDVAQIQLSSLAVSLLSLTLFVIVDVQPRLSYVSSFSKPSQSPYLSLLTRFGPAAVVARWCSRTVLV